MKKLLIASTALVATAGFASADITLTGEAQMGVIYESNAGVAGGASTTFQTEIDFNIVGSGTTDGGLTFGASLDLDDNSGPTVASNDPEVFISMSGLTLTMGNVSDAADGIGFADVGYDGLGVDDDAEAVKTGNNTEALVEYKTGGLTLQLGLEDTSAGVNTGGDYSASVSYNFGTITAGVGVVYNNVIPGNAGEFTAVSGEIGGKFGDFSANAFAAQKDFSAAGVQTQTSFGLDVGYTMGATTITVAYGSEVHNVAGDGADYGIGVAYALGGGATLQAGIASVDTAAAARETKASLGVAMKF